VQPKIYFVDQHGIDEHLIDSDVLTVLQRLRQAGHTAYLVGGSVRDLLLKRSPKDFDISTSAKPEEIKSLFHRNCILIGRRFRLAHIRFGHKIIEVSTFRSGENEGDLIVHDNKWGTPEEDVIRRDFTLNGLFYDSATHSVIDYVDGWKDIHQGILRTIGKPIIRFKQDPVRMIRLLKFQARFGFSISEETKDALSRCQEEILKSSPARILEEILRMLESGAASKFFHLMTESGLLEHLFPCLTHFLEGKHGKEIYGFLAHADRINIARGKNPIDRAVLTSCLLFPILQKEIKAQYLDKELIPHIGEVMTVTNSLIRAFVTSSFSHFPRKLSSTVCAILTTQYRLTPPSGKRHPKSKLLKNKEFELSLRLLKIRSLVDNSLADVYRFWYELYHHEHRGERRRSHPSIQNAKN
jgi:poly(A) polymerase